MTSNPSSNRIAWMLPKWPLPMQDGARIANINLMKGLTSLGVTIDVIAIVGEDENCSVDELKKISGISECFIVRRPTNGRSIGVSRILNTLKSFLFHPWLAVTLTPFSKSHVRREVSRILEKGQWSTLVYDGLHSAAHASIAGVYQKPASVSKVIYRAHNVEAEIWNRKTAQTKFPLNLFFCFQTYLMRRFEDSLVRQAKSVTTVSEVDLELFRKTVPNLMGEVVPIGYDFGKAPEKTRHQETLLFLGKLDWPPNRDGLVWFLDQVWPIARQKRPSLELCIAGSGNSDWLKARGEIPGIKFLGRIESVDDVYRDCLVSLVPIFYGSGTRVKAIEASRYGRACLSTAIGVEGLGLEAGETFIQAETADDWIRALVDLNSARATEMGQRAYETLKRNFHLPVAAEKFLNAIKGS